MNSNMSKEDLEAVDILIKFVTDAVNHKEVKCDRTFVSVIKQVNPNGTYVVLDEFGQDRTVKCSIPGMELQTGKNVWVKMPCNSLNKMHICGVV